MIDMIDLEQRKSIKLILEDNRELFSQSSGSSCNHQAWTGGYIDHVTECMNLAIQFYLTLNVCRSLEFSLSEALVVMFLHDIEKPWRYKPNQETGQFETIPGLEDKAARAGNRNDTIASYGLQLNARQLNAMKYVEGELDDYTPKKRKMWPLAAFCHLCDVWSARGWPNFPQAYNDYWPGARRVTDETASQTICPDCGSVMLVTDPTEQEVGLIRHCTNSSCSKQLDIVI
jgi:hypothetical protein